MTNNNPGDGSSRGQDHLDHSRSASAEDGTSDHGQVDENTPLSSLHLSGWPRNALARAGLTTVEQVAGMADSELLRIPSLGAKGLREIHSRIGKQAADQESASEPRSSEPDPLDEIPGPDLSTDTDPQLISLLNDAADIAIKGRDFVVFRQRLGIPQGGS